MKILTEATGILRYSTRCKAVRQAMFALLAMTIICIVIVLVWWGPAKREQVQLSQNINDRRAAMVAAVRTAQVAQAQRDALPAVALLEKKLEVRTGQADLIQGIARLAAKRGVRVLSQSFDEGRVQYSDAQLYLELGLQGDYASLRKMMSDMATLPMWIEVVEARLERTGEGGALVRAQMRLLTYRAAKGQQ
ncbi:MAG: type 4a pilus biogenesis protein PilO [Gallionellaceae bacterium]|jgi:Tfp pilus assembly protein PilO